MHIKLYFAEKPHTINYAGLDTKVAAMQAMLDKYSQIITSIGKPVNPKISATRTEEVVILTGSTGRLGCHLLNQLVADPKVRHIYALNRESSGEHGTLVARHEAALRAWGLTEDILHCGKVTLVVCSYTQDKLGLDAETYEKLAGSVTCIIHNGA